MADIVLAYKLLDQQEESSSSRAGGVALQSKHLSIGKVQPSHFTTAIWTEVSVLRACVHENIVDLYAIFHAQQEKQIWLLLEYAHAGDMDKEIERTKPRCYLEEHHARYYMNQICAGMSYLHSKEVRHNDMHCGNVVLRYRHDCSKVCMIADFGGSMILNHDEMQLPDRFARDVTAVQRIALDMTYRAGLLSPQLNDMCRRPDVIIPTISQLIKHPWFTAGPAVAHMPKAPTPLLKSASVVQAMGYQTQAHVSGVTPPPEPLIHDEAVTQETKRRSLVQRTRHALRNLPRHISQTLRRRSSSAAQASTGIEETQEPASAHAAAFQDQQLDSDVSHVKQKRSLGKRIRSLTRVFNRRVQTETPSETAAEAVQADQVSEAAPVPASVPVQAPMSLRGTATRPSASSRPSSSPRAFF